MTTLIIQWQNATRPADKRMKVEACYKKRLLELCNTEQHAKALHRLHKAQPSPCSQWARLNAVAHIEATADLLPSERKEARFIVRFE